MNCSLLFYSSRSSERPRLTISSSCYRVAISDLFEFKASLLFTLTKIVFLGLLLFTFIKFIIVLERWLADSCFG